MNGEKMTDLAILITSELASLDTNIRSVQEACEPRIENHRLGEEAERCRSESQHCKVDGHCIDWFPVHHFHLDRIQRVD